MGLARIAEGHAIIVLDQGWLALPAAPAVGVHAAQRPQRLGPDQPGEEMVVARPYRSPAAQHALHAADEISGNL